MLSEFFGCKSIIIFLNNDVTKYIFSFFFCNQTKKMFDFS
jgi:hypothetical protein